MDRNLKELTNSELQMYTQSLTDRFEVTKNKIISLCKELEDIDSEYDKAKNEMKLRQNL